MRARTGFFTIALGTYVSVAAAMADPPAVPAPPAVPQAAAPATAGTSQRLRGTLTAFDGPFLTLKTGEKKSIVVGMTADTHIVHNRTLKLTDLQPGAYVGVAALVGGDGKLRAQGIRLYPENMRGMGEGSYPIDPANPSRIIINGSVTAIAPGGIGGTVSIAFHGATPAPGSTTCGGRAVAGGCAGSADIQFARGVPIIAIEPGDTSLLQVGAVVTASASADASGALVATTVTVERDAPPPK